MRSGTGVRDMKMKAGAIQPRNAGLCRVARSKASWRRTACGAGWHPTAGWQLVGRPLQGFIHWLARSHADRTPSLDTVLRPSGTRPSGAPWDRSPHKSAPENRVANPPQAIKTDTSLSDTVVAAGRLG